MRPDRSWACGAILMAAGVALGDPPGPSGRLKELSTAGPSAPTHSLFSPSSPTPVAGVEPLVVGTATDFAAAALTTSKNGTEFKASMVPLAAFDLPYMAFVSDAGLTLTADTSSSLTRATVSTGYNPFSLRGSRASQAMEAASARFQCGTLPDDAALCKASCATLVDAKQREVCEKRCAEAFDKANKTCNARREATEWSYINTGWVPALGLSASADLYPTGSQQDPKSTAAASQSLNGWGGFTVQASLSFRPAETVQADLYGSLKPWWRPSGDPAARMARYLGGGATVAWLFHSFLDRARPEQTADYLKSGFIPGIAMGISGQILSCLSEDTCNKGRTDQYSGTPFLEVRVKSQAQLRISVPITYYTLRGSNGSELAPTFTLAGTIGAP